MKNTKSPIIIVFLIILNISTLFSQPLPQDIRNIAVSLASFNFNVFKSVPSDNSIISVGEASHGQRDAFQMKKNIFINLVIHQNYKIFALEAGVSECRKINDYIQNGKGNAKNALLYLGYGVWENESFLELIEWMKNYNDTIVHDNNKLSFYGFDCQKTHGAISKLKFLCQNYNVVDFDSTVFEKLLYLDNKSDRKKSKSILKDTKKIISIINNNISKDSSMSSINKKLLILETNTLIQKCLMDSKFGNKSYIYRAKFMAENLVNIQKITRQKIVMSAHNGHIFKDKKAKEMGFFIHEMIGNKYFALGIEFNKGSITGFTMDSVNYYSRVVLVSDSLNSKNLAWYFKDVPFTSSYVNLRDLDNKYISFFNQLWKMSSLKGCYGNKRCNERFWKINPYKSYDGIIFIRDAIPSSLLWEFRPIKGYEYR